MENDQQKIDFLKWKIQFTKETIKIWQEWQRIDLKEYEASYRRKTRRIDQLEETLESDIKKLEDLEGENGEGDFRHDEAEDNKLADQI